MDGIHPRADEGYAYAEPSDIIHGRIMNADTDAIYVKNGGRTFAIALNGQDNPIIEYGLKERV